MTSSPSKRQSDALRDLARGEPVSLQISGACMEPVLRDGDRVFLQGRVRYYPGDILVFRTHAGQLTAHRMLGLYRRGGQWRYLTRSDNEPEPDTAIPYKHILGRLIAIGDPDRNLHIPPLTRLACAGAFIKLGLARLGRAKAES